MLRRASARALAAGARAASSEAGGNFVRVVEVGPRDGLQNEKQYDGMVPTEAKVCLIERLCSAGLRSVEAAAFVSPTWVPQMADGKEVLARVGKQVAPRFADAVFPVLVPNDKGLTRALEAGAKEVAVFAAATEGFSKANTNCTIKEALSRFEGVVRHANDEGVKVRGYVSCVLGCPYEGTVAPEQAAAVAKRLLSMGCYEVSMGDTIGVGTPGGVDRLLDALDEAGVPVQQVALHCHDTYGMALANVAAGVRRGVRVVDASVGGLGGCPYAKGATGNVATEDVVYMLHGMGYETGVDMDRLLDANEYIFGVLGRGTESRVARTLLAKRRQQAAKDCDGMPSAKL